MLLRQSKPSLFDLDILHKLASSEDVDMVKRQREVDMGPRRLRLAAEIIIWRQANRHLFVLDPKLEGRMCTRFCATLWGLDVLATDGMIGEHESKPDIEAQLDTVNLQSHLPETTFDLRQPLARRNEFSDIVPSGDFPVIFTTSARSTGAGGTFESFINEANLTCSREDEKLETWIGRYLTQAEPPPIKVHRPTFKDTHGAIEESSEYLSYLACTGIDEWLQLR